MGKALCEMPAEGEDEHVNISIKTLSYFILCKRQPTFAFTYRYWLIQKRDTSVIPSSTSTATDTQFISYTWLKLMQFHTTALR